MNIPPSSAPPAGTGALPQEQTPVPSPCIGICRMVPESGLCEGCLRTIDEIAGWRDAGDDERRIIWRRIRERQR